MPRAKGQDCPGPNNRRWLTKCLHEAMDIYGSKPLIPYSCWCLFGPGFDPAQNWMGSRKKSRSHCEKMSAVRQVFSYKPTRLERRDLIALKERAETWNPIKAPWLLREKYAKNLPFLVKILSLLTKTILEISKISLSFIHFPLYSSSMYFYPSFMFKFPLFIFQIHGFSW